MRFLGPVLALTLALTVSAHSETPFQFTQEWQAEQLSFAIRRVLSEPEKKQQYERPSQRLGPQFHFIWDEEQLFTAEQALTNPKAIPPDDKWLASHPEAWERFEKIKDKLHNSPTMTWPMGTRRHITFTLGQTIMMGMALTRYHCRQTHGPGFVRWMDDQGQAQQLQQTEYWGEDDGYDENENLNKFSPEMCAYYTQRAEALFKEVEAHKMSTFGGVDWWTALPPWYMLEDAVNMVQNWK